MTRLTRNFSFAVAALSIISHPARSDEPSDGQKAFSGILSIWKNDDGPIKSAHFDIDKSEIVRKGTLPGRQAFIGGAPPVARVLPPKDVALEATMVVAFDGRRMRYERRGLAWSAALEDFSPEHFISVFDGLEARSLHGRTHNSPNDPSRAFAHNKAEHPDWDNTNLLPLLWRFRPPPADSPVGFAPQEWAFAGSREKDGRQCLTFECRARPDRLRKCLIDPQQGHGIVRYEAFFGDECIYQIDATYERDKTGAWYPGQWRIEYFREGEPRSSHVFRVREHSFNKPSEKSLFTLVFPKGTQVTDYRTRQTYIATEPDD